MDYSEESSELHREGEYRPESLLVLSSLPMREKEKYYKMLLNNDAKFRRDEEGNYIANIRLFGPNIKKLACPHTPTPKKKDSASFASVYKERYERLKAYGFIKVEVRQIKSNFVFNVNSFPRFVSLIAHEGDVVKPKLRSLNWLMKIVDDLYDNRYALEALEAEKDEDGYPRGVNPAQVCVLVRMNPSR
jgi:hypothetical protein